LADLIRRQFLRRIGATAAVSPSLFCSSTDTAGYDLLIAGGRVIDPAQSVDQPLDVAIADGKIAKVAANIPKSQARQVFDAAGKIVTPGLIDMHGHVFDSFVNVSIDADSVWLPKGVTTIFDCGSSGASTFPGFRKHIVSRARTRIYALLNISKIGLTVMNELYLEPTLIDPKAAIQTIEANRDVILGIKVRINGRDEEVPHDVDALKKAREASDATGVPIMMHWTNEPRLLAILKKGDILVHPFNPPKSGPSLLGPDGKVFPQILELKDRGIFTDFAHGNHLLWETAEKAAAQGWFPDTISTDIWTAHVGANGVVQDLVTTMSKFLYLGLPLNQAIEKVTVNPVKILKIPEKIGSLRVGDQADVSIIRVADGDYELLDSTRQKRVARKRIVPVAAVRAGSLVLSKEG
jgi:dihydroorotase